MVNQYNGNGVRRFISAVMYRVCTSYTGWINIFNRNELNDNKCKLWEWLFVTTPDNDLGMSTFYNILILFLKKTAEAHLFCKFNAHRSA